MVMVKILSVSSSPYIMLKYYSNSAENLIIKNTTVFTHEISRIFKHPIENALRFLIRLPDHLSVTGCELGERVLFAEVYGTFFIMV